MKSSKTPPSEPPTPLQFKPQPSRHRSSNSLPRKPLPVVGWRELVDLPGIALTGIPAKIDTGARTSSLHARVIDRFERDGRPFVRFAVDWDEIAHEGEAVEVDVRGITSSNGETQLRYVIKTPLRIGNIEFRAELSLADRSDMKFPMLIGRTALRRRFVVDSGHSWLQSPGAPDSLRANLT